MTQNHVTTVTFPANAADTALDNPRDAVAPQDGIAPPTESARDASTPESATTHEDELRTLAHAKWEAAGCPPGDGINSGWKPSAT